jgi:hypothetical protein
MHWPSSEAMERPPLRMIKFSIYSTKDPEILAMFS